MAIQIEDYYLIRDFVKKFKISGKVLILGDCAYHFTHKDLKIKKQSDIQTDLFINHLGFELVETVDIVGNSTYNFDLAGKLPEDLKNKYDLIIDAGCLSCCFDVISVLKNLHSALKNNGYIMFFPFFTGFFGRGYYSFQPGFFQDYFKLNNYSLLYLGLRTYNKYNAFLRKIFRKKYLWKEMSKVANFYNGKILTENFTKEPEYINNKMSIGVIGKKNMSNEIIMPTPLLINND